MTFNGARISELYWAPACALVVEAALNNNVFDYLDVQGGLAAEISSELNVPLRLLQPLLEVLVGMGLAQKDPADRYSLTPDASMLMVSTKAEFQGGPLRNIRRQLELFGELSEGIRAGVSNRRIDQEGPGTERYSETVSGISSLSYLLAKVLNMELRPWELNRPFRVLDLGAGSGIWGITLARESLNVHVTAVDWPGVLPAVANAAAKYSVLDRFKIVSGDVRTFEFGDGFDLIVLGNLLHSLGPEIGLLVISKAFAAIAPGGSLAIGEFLLNRQRTEPLSALLFGLMMALTTENGSVFSFDQLAEWLMSAGFSKPRLLRRIGDASLVVAEKSLEEGGMVHSDHTARCA